MSYRPEMTSRRLFFFSCAVALLLINCSEKGPVQAPRAIPVRAGDVRKMDVPVQLKGIGKVEAYLTVSVKTRVDGEIVGVYFKQGQEVKQGQLLFQIDPRTYNAALKQAEAQLVRDIAQANNAGQEADRYKLLAEKDYVPKDQYDQLRATADATAAVVNADKANIEASRLQVSYCSIKSPIDGQVGSILVNLGNTVKANDVPMLTINKVSPIYVTFSVPEQHLAVVKKHLAEAQLTAETIIPGEEDRPIKGTLTFIDNAVDSSTGTIQLKATFDNADRRLWPGQFVNISVSLSIDRDAIVMPTTALQPGQEGQYVFIIKPDLTVERRDVTVARTFEGLSVVNGGVAPGDRVITDGHIQLVPGVKVHIQAGPEAPRNGTA